MTDNMKIIYLINLLKEIHKIKYLINLLKENIPKKTCFFDGKVFLSFRKWTKINVHFSKVQTFPRENINCLTIIEFYGLTTEKIILTLLR